MLAWCLPIMNYTLLVVPRWGRRCIGFIAVVITVAIAGNSSVRACRSPPPNDVRYR